MKVFLSWSGTSSQKVALALKDWLPQVIQVIEPYVSSEDISKGERWSVDIAKELDTTNFGILCVTKENSNAPWLNFEAGALSKAFEKSRVTPFLLDIKPTDIQGPLVQFQATQFIKEDFKKLLYSINGSSDSVILPEGRLEKSFEAWWPQLSSTLDEIISESSSNIEKNKKQKINKTELLLEQVLELVRSQHLKISDPEQLLPAEYIAQVNSKLLVNRKVLTKSDISSLQDAWVLLNETFQEIEGQAVSEKLDKALLMLAKPLQSVLSEH